MTKQIHYALPDPFYNIDLTPIGFEGFHNVAKEGKLDIAIDTHGTLRQPGVAITCCNDGLRPVFFKLEALDEEVPSPFK